MPELNGTQPEINSDNFLGPNTTRGLGIENTNDLTIIRPWFRGGETYCAEFTLRTQESLNKLVAKACVTICPCEVMNDWIDRRQTLSAHGVQVPELVARFDGATIVEEFIPMTLAQAFAEADEKGQAEINMALTDTIERIVSAGFSPISLHDVRSRGNDVVVVDFGSDLGGICHTNPGTELSADKLEKLRRSTGITTRG